MFSCSVKNSLLGFALLSLFSLSALGDAAKPYSHYRFQGRVSRTMRPRSFPIEVRSRYGARWCDNTIYQLKEALDSAIYIRERGDYDAAINTLIDGLQSVKPSTFGPQSGPLTARAISRGLNMANVLAQIEQGESNGATTMMHFLFNYYKFIFDVAEKLDKPYYIPYFDCDDCDGSGPRDIDEFERNLVQYTKDQVQVILDVMSGASKTADGELGVVAPRVPMGSSDAFLTLLSMAAEGAAWDLQETVQGVRYLCASEALQDLSDRIENGGFYDQVQAVNASYYRATHILKQIHVDGDGFCSGWRGSREE